MNRRTLTTVLVCISVAFAATELRAQSAARDSLQTTGGLSLGVSGLRSSDGTTVVGDLMWVGAEMNDGIGVRLLRQGLAPDVHGYAAMIVIGGPPRDNMPWLRLDFGLGYAGQQSPRTLKFYQRHGVGAQLGLTIAPVHFGIVRPELNGWAVVATSARFLGVSLGVRILDPRQR
jgi:hypothetical protein